MQSGIEPVSALISHLTEHIRPTWARWAMERNGAHWQLRHAELTIGVKPPGYAHRKWIYPNYRFLEQPATIHQIMAALGGKTVRLGQLGVRSEPLHAAANRMRLQSYSDFGGHRLIWPATRYELSRLSPANANAGNEPLISLESPSFAHYESAYSAFFRPGEPPRWQQSAGVVLYDLDTDARIAQLTIELGEVVVEVAGADLSGCKLQGSSSGRSVAVAIESPGPVRLPLPEPFISELLIVLADGNGWRDLRLLNPPGQPNPADPSIVWDDPGFELAVLLAGGESAGVEFKSRLPTKSVESIRTALKAVPAFANGSGGVLIFGVDDDGLVVGVDGNIAGEIARLTNLIHDHVHPVAPHRIEAQIVDGKSVLLVHVDAGANKPYAMFRDPPQFFARHGATTFHATREEVIQLAAWSTPGGRYR